jgi:hypothetical protein
MYDDMLSAAITKPSGTFIAMQIVTAVFYHYFINKRELSNWDTSPI